ncbi:hypothetical protein BDAP_000986 [Binucleata daphniae]
MQFFVLIPLCLGSEFCIPNNVQVLNSAGDFFEPDKLPDDTDVYKVFNCIYTQLRPVSKRHATTEMLFFNSVIKKLENNVVDENVFRWFLSIYNGFLRTYSQRNNLGVSTFDTKLIKTDVTIDCILDKFGNTQDERRIMLAFVDTFIVEVNLNLKKYNDMNKVKMQNTKDKQQTNYEVYLHVISYLMHVIKNAIIQKNEMTNTASLVVLPYVQQTRDNKTKNMYVYVDSTRNTISGATDESCGTNKTGCNMPSKDCTKSDSYVQSLYRDYLMHQARQRRSTNNDRDNEQRYENYRCHVKNKRCETNDAFESEVEQMESCDTETSQRKHATPPPQPLQRTKPFIRYQNTPSEYFEQARDREYAHSMLQTGDDNTRPNYDTFYDNGALSTSYAQPRAYANNHYHPHAQDSASNAHFQRQYANEKHVNFANMLPTNTATCSGTRKKPSRMSYDGITYV